MYTYSSMYEYLCIQYSVRIHFCKCTRLGFYHTHTHTCNLNYVPLVCVNLLSTNWMFFRRIFYIKIKLYNDMSLVAYSQISQAEDATIHCKQ